MVSKVTTKPKFDLLLWGLAVVALLSGLGGHMYFQAASLLIRVLGLLAALGFAVFLASQTQSGKVFFKYWQEATVEVRRVVWPTKKETMQSTMAVLVMVFIMGLVLWTIDTILVWIIGGLLR